MDDESANTQVHTNKVSDERRSRQSLHFADFLFQLTQLLLLDDIKNEQVTTCESPVRSLSLLFRYATKIFINDDDDDDVDDDSNNQNTSQTCGACKDAITDQFYLRVGSKAYHESCLQCAVCQIALDKQSTCFLKGLQILCRQDYYK